MKLIIDAQLPRKLCNLLGTLGIDAVHVDQLPQGDESIDSEIARYADANQLTVVTKDLDFYNSHITLNSPAKLLLITTGNIRNKKLFKLFIDNYLQIKEALASSSFVEFNNQGILCHREDN